MSVTNIVLNALNSRVNLNRLNYNKLPVLPAKTLLKTLKLERKLNKIEELTSAGQKYFSTLYLPAIESYAEAVQLAPATAANHHAGPGGLLAHTINVVEEALRRRKSYSLPQFSSAEVIYAQEHVWTYAVFTGALLHNIGKMVSSTQVVLDDGRVWTPHHGSVYRSGAKSYKIEFFKSSAKLHNQISNSFFYMLPEKGRGWLAQYPEILAQLSAWLYGDHYESGAIGEIVSLADRTSISNNLEYGGKHLRFTSSLSTSMVERLITELRNLLQEGKITINRSEGKIGWCDEYFTYLESNTTANLLRKRLLQTGAIDIPADNSRIFNILQEHGHIVSTPGGGAIWSLVVNDKLKLAVLKFETQRLFNPSNWPPPFTGKLSINENVADTMNNENSHMLASVSCKNETVYCDHIASSNETSADTDNDIYGESELNIAAAELDNIARPQITTPVVQSVFNNTTPPLFQLQDPEIAHYFLDWIRQGLREGKITVNRKSALIHIVKEGVLVLTPLAFRQFTRKHEFLMDSEHNEDDVVRRIQNRLQKVMTTTRLHRKTEKGLNIHTYKITGPNKDSIIRGWLLPYSVIYGDKKPPDINSALENLSGIAETT